VAAVANRYPNWDILRLYAALVVVFIHWRANQFPHGGGPNLALGIDPVPAFVCLSGFLIPGSLASSVREHAADGWKHFIWKRVLRVYPAFLLSIVLVAVLYGLRAAGFTFLTYLTAGLIVMPMSRNGALWSLMLEEVLYGIHLSSALRKLFTPRNVVLCMAASIGIWMLVRSGPPVPSSMFRSSTAFFAGNLAYLYRERLIKISGWWFLAAIAVLFVKSNIFPSLKMDSPSFVFITAVQSVCWVMAARNLPQVPAKKWVDLSYGVYIFHVPVLISVVKYGGLSSRAIFGTTVVITLLLAATSWYCLESQALKFKRTLPKWPRRPATAPEPAVVAYLANLEPGPVESAPQTASLGAAAIRGEEPASY
jgi:peptidoglycan/LPS O-acetylase OafA/YrhL